MGGRGLKNKKTYRDRWDWLKDVEDHRLKNYIKRSDHIGTGQDPTGRSIHDVAYWAEKELERRGR